MLVELNGINKSYFTKDIETRALRDISLQIGAGEYVAIEGPSGCGKSTLLAILGLLDRPNSGQYRLNGRDVSSLRAGEMAAIRNRDIGFVFQGFNLISDLSVDKNIELPLEIRGMTKGERKARVREVLDRVRMSHRASHMPFQLSGGEQQRVAVARALAGDPLILLADEPTGNLDSKNGEAVMDLLSELHRSGSTILMVTHDARFARRAQRSIGLLDGMLVEGELALASM